MLFNLIVTLLVVYELLILARVLLSWFPNIDSRNPIVQFIFDLTEPVLRPIREMLPQNMMFDFSPIIVFLIIQVLITVLRVM
ncbi:MAG: YggT family protein [Chloroflexi bacterium]|nr:YggT family protein [Chloroflexota bacterium]